jgi:glutaredoxin 3
MTNTVVWTRDRCPYCDMAKSMLRGKNISFEERNLSEGKWSREELLAVVPGARTVPQIFLHGKYVGGYTDLESYFEEHDMWRND